MTINFDANDNLTTILKRLREAPEDQLELIVPRRSVFWQNAVNKRLLEKVAQESGKTVHLAREGEKGTEGKEEPEKSLRSSLSTPSKPSKTSRKSPNRSFKKWLAGGLILLLLAASVAFGAVYYYLPKATVTLKVSKKSLEKETAVRIDPQADAVNQEENIIPGREIHSQQTASKSFKATDSKLVGAKALGEVMIHNWTGTVVTFDKGTVLIVDDGQDEYSKLQFTTDAAVQIPPASTQLEDDKKTTQAGTATVPVTAVKFGTEYNLPANLDFKIEDRSFNNFSAINKQAFTGGTTESVTIVAQEDLNNAQEQLKNELFAKGKEALQEEAEDDEKIAQETIDHATTFAEFSNEIGDETQEFELAMRTVSTAVAYKEKELKSLLAESLKESVPDGFKLSDAEEVITVKDVKRQGDNTLLATGTIKTLVVPDINTTEIKAELVGVKPARAQEILKNVPHLAGFNLSITPRFPEPIATLPYRPERIDVTIEVQ